MTGADILERQVYNISSGIKEQPCQVYIVLFNFRIPGTGLPLQISQ